MFPKHYDAAAPPCNFLRVLTALTVHSHPSVPEQHRGERDGCRTTRGIVSDYYGGLPPGPLCPAR